MIEVPAYYAAQKEAYLQQVNRLRPADAVLRYVVLLLSCGSHASWS